MSNRMSITLGEEEGDFVLEASGVELARCRSLMEVVPMTIGQLVLLALHSSASFCALHASSVRRDNQTFLFVGASGAGKSTLAAALAASGFHYLADDTVSLDHQGCCLEPIPTPPCVKDGSWALLREYYPEIDHLPTHRRADGRSLRYLEGIQRSRPANGGRFNDSLSLIFVSYEPSGAGEIKPLTCAEALFRLLAHFYVLGDGLQPRDVDGLIEWVGSARRFSMSSASLKQSISMVRALCT